MKIATWLAAGVIVASAAAGCSVTVNDNDGGTGSGATGGTGGSGGSTGGSGGSSATGGASGSAGSAGTTGGSGGASDAGSDTGGIACTNNPNTDPRCNTCAFNKCQMDHCACNALSTCRGPMLKFYMCISMPGADEVTCATNFAKDANVDGSGAGLVNDLATCVLDDCAGICQGGDAAVRNRNLSEAFRAAMGHSDQR